MLALLLLQASPCPALSSLRMGGRYYADPRFGHLRSNRNLQVARARRRRFPLISTPPSPPLMDFHLCLHCTRFVCPLASVRVVGSSLLFRSYINSLERNRTDFTVRILTLNFGAAASITVGRSLSSLLKPRRNYVECAVKQA